MEQLPNMPGTALICRSMKTDLSALQKKMHGSLKTNGVVVNEAVSQYCLKLTTFLPEVEQEYAKQTSMDLSSEYVTNAICDFFDCLSCSLIFKH